jgi:hypothetical protein
MRKATVAAMAEVTTAGAEAITAEAITAEAITAEAITAEAITAEATMAEVIMVAATMAHTSIGAPGCTKIDPPTSITSWAGLTTATSGSAAVGIVGTAAGTPTVWAPAGFMLMAYGSGTR